MTLFLRLACWVALATATRLTRTLWQRAAWSTPGEARAVAPSRHRPLVGGPAAALGSALMLLLMLMLVLGIGDAELGAPGHLGATPPEAATLPGAAEALDADSEAPGRAQGRIAAAIDTLAGRLQRQPDDADGWQTLARSYAAIGRHAAAVDAFRRAVELRPDNATWLAEYAFSSAVLTPYPDTGEPARLIERALQIDPVNPKALLLVGTLALDRKDYDGAIESWERLARIEAADGAVARQLQASIAQTRQLAARAGVVPVSTTTTTRMRARASHAQFVIDPVARLP